MSLLPRLTCDDVGESMSAKVAYKLAGEATVALLILPLCLKLHTVFMEGAADLDSKLVAITNAINDLCGELSSKSESIIGDIIQIKSLSTKLNDSCQSLQSAQLDVKTQLKNYFADAVWWLLEKIGLVVGGSAATVTSVAVVADAVKGEKVTKISYVNLIWSRIMNIRHETVCKFAAMWEKLVESLGLVGTICKEPELMLPSYKLKI